MADLVLQSPNVQPSQAILALATGIDDQEQMAGLDIKVHASDQGWSLSCHIKRSESDAEGLWEDLGLDPAELARVGLNEHNGINLRPIGEEMISYLVRRDWSNEQSARPVSGEHLVVGPPSQSPEALGTLLQRLNAHATCCRAAIFDDRQGRSFTLFHLRDDPGRGSTLRHFLRAVGDVGGPVLKAFQVEQGTLFLPVNPPAMSLQSVARLLSQFPALFGSEAKPQDGWKPEALLFAVARAEDLPGCHEENDFWFDTRDTRFFGATHFLRDHNHPKISIAKPHLDEERGIQELQARLRRRDGTFGVALALRQDRRTLFVRDDAEETRKEAARKQALLEAEKRRIELMLKRLKSDYTKQSLLIVAPESRFDLLARLFRAIIADQKGWHGLRYARLQHPLGQPPAFGGEPHHSFLLPAGPASQKLLNSVKMHQKELSLFWSDPNWTALYGTHAKVTVMVPWQQALHPLPQSWQAQDMDSFLVEMVDRWTDSEITLAEGRPAYLVFAPGAGAGGTQEMHLDVFLDTDFEPLTGEVMVWLNQLLSRRSQRGLDAESLKVAEATSKDTLNLMADARLAAHKQLVAARAEDISATMTKAWGDLRNAIDKEADTLLQDLDTHHSKVAELESLILEMEARYAEAQKLVADITVTQESLHTDLKRKTGRQLTAINDFMAQIRQRNATFESALRQGQETRDKMQRELDALKKKWYS